MAYKKRWRYCAFCGCRYDSKGGSTMFCMPAHAARNRKKLAKRIIVV